MPVFLPYTLVQNSTFHVFSCIPKNKTIATKDRIKVSGRKYTNKQVWPFIMAMKTCRQHVKAKKEGWEGA